MTHARQLIREGVASVLASSPTNWGQVHKSRVESSRQIWPYLMVFDRGDTVDDISESAPCIYLTTVPITVIGMLRAPGSGDTQTIEDKKDAMAEEIETKLTSTTLRAVSGLSGIQKFTKKGTDPVYVEDEAGNVIYMELTMGFEVVYAVAEGSPGTII